MNFEALPCMLKNADGTPMYGLLIRPLLQSGAGPSPAPESPTDGAAPSGAGNFAPILPRGGEAPYNPVFIPAAAVHGFHQAHARRNFFEPRNPFESETAACPIPSDPFSRLSGDRFGPADVAETRTPPIHPQNHLCNGDLAEILREIDSADISSFLRDVSFEARDSAQQPDPDCCVSFADRFVSTPFAPAAPRRFQNYFPPSEASPRTADAAPPSSSAVEPTDRSDSTPPPPDVRDFAGPSDPEQLRRPPNPESARGAHLGSYRDGTGAGSPDSGIQSIGESPRAPPRDSFRRRAETGGGDSPRASDLPSVGYELISDCEKSPGFVDQKRKKRDAKDFGDMPRLEPEPGPSGLFPNFDSNGADPALLIDKILSSLPPDKLASFSKLFEAKLEAAGLRDRIGSATTAPSPAARREADAENEAAKKLVEYRKKMKRKREDRATTRLLDDLCRRFRAFPTTAAPLLPRPGNFFTVVDWEAVLSRLRVDPPAADAAQNLEAEASEDGGEDSAPAARSSLKVRIKLLRAKTEKPDSKGDETRPDLVRSPPRSDAFGSNLPPKKRFKRNPPPPASPEPSAAPRVPAASAPPKLPLMTTIRKRKRLPYPWDRKKKKKKRAEGEDASAVPESGPPLLKIEPVAAPLASPLPSPAAPLSEAKRRRLSPGLLRKCGRCGFWLKVGLDEKSDCAEPTSCETCRRSVRPPAFPIRLTPPKKIFSKFGVHFDPFSTEIDKNKGPSPVNLWSPQRCATLPAAVDFQLPFDLWWRFVYQKEYICSNPSVNYKRISRNIYADSKVARAPNCQPCGCSSTDRDGETCGEGCLNRLMFTECTPSLCPCGERCSNRRFQKRLWAPGLEKFSTGAKGLGVRATAPLRAGTFVCEYVGEVVNAETFAERTRSWYRRCRHHYALTVDSGAVVDAYRCGGVARFINHSCEPNCEVQKWVVNGRYRMGVFAVKDVAAGRELTYNYNFRSFSRPQRCLCGSAKCSGAVGGSFKPVRRGANRSATALDLKTSAANGPTTAASSSDVATGRPYLARLLIKSGRHKHSAAIYETTDEVYAKFFVLRKIGRPKSFERRPDSGPRLVQSALSLITEKIKRLRGSSGEIVSAEVESSLPETGRALARASAVLPPESPELPLCRLLVRILGADEAEPSTDEPLVGAYDPDDDSGVWTPRADAAHPLDDKVRCVCGIFDEDGTMVQCDRCLYWLHADCVGGSVVFDPTVNFACDFCTGEGDARSVFRDSLLTPQPRVRLPHCTYYRSLLNGRLQIRIGDCVYVKRSVEERHKRILAAFNRRCVRNDGEPSPAPVGDEENDADASEPGPFRRSQLRIMRVERLFVGPEGVRLMFGSYFALPHETFCEPSRRFFRNEVFVTPLYDTRPVEAVVGRCLVLDPHTFRKGRPLYPRYAEADVYVCEFRVDKGQRLFDKSSLNSRYPVNTKPHIFLPFPQRLRISRDFTPFSECPVSDGMKKSGKEVRGDAAASTQWNAGMLRHSDAKQLEVLVKRIRLEQLASVLFAKVDRKQL